MGFVLLNPNVGAQRRRVIREFGTACCKHLRLRNFDSSASFGGQTSI